MLIKVDSTIDMKERTLHRLTVLCETKRNDTLQNSTLQNSSLRNGTLRNDLNYYPGPRGFLLISSFSFGNLQRGALIEVPSQEERKSLVKIVENLTIMLAQHLNETK